MEEVLLILAALLAKEVVPTLVEQEALQVLLQVLGQHQVLVGEGGGLRPAMVPMEQEPTEQ